PNREKRRRPEARLWHDRAGPRIDLEIAVQDLVVDFKEIAKSSADGIVDQHRRRAELGFYCGNHGVELRFVRQIGGIAFGIGDLPFKRAKVDGSGTLILPRELSGSTGDAYRPSPSGPVLSGLR